MRGFPIVSLGAITTSVDTYVEYTPHNSAIVIPEFELNLKSKSILVVIKLQLSINIAVDIIKVVMLNLLKLNQII